LIDSPDKTPLLQLGGGASKIFAPDGQQISEDLPHDQEGLVFADIDLGMISLAKAVADPAGHYSRPDVTQLLVNREKRSPVRSIADAQNEAKQEPASEPSPGTPPNLEIVARSS
ncbi:MAG: carbon-nitrogen hydrolase family protein, partial [Pseudomonadota bacterium]